MLASPVHLKLYLEINDLEWGSFDFQADGNSRGLPLGKIVLWDTETTVAPN